MVSTAARAAIEGPNRRRLRPRVRQWTPPRSRPVPALRLRHARPPLCGRRRSPAWTERPAVVVHPRAARRPPRGRPAIAGMPTRPRARGAASSRWASTTATIRASSTPPRIASSGRTPAAARYRLGRPARWDRSRADCNPNCNPAVTHACCGKRPSLLVSPAHEHKPKHSRYPAVTVLRDDDERGREVRVGLLNGLLERCMGLLARPRFGIGYPVVGRRDLFARGGRACCS